MATYAESQSVVDVVAKVGELRMIYGGIAWETHLRFHEWISLADLIEILSEGYGFRDTTPLRAFSMEMV